MAEGYIPKVPDVRVGTFTVPCQAPSYVDADFTFSTPFTGTPHVFLDNYNGLNNEVIQNNISYAVYNVSNTGFTVRVGNNSDTNLGTGANGYIAVLF